MNDTEFLEDQYEDLSLVALNEVSYLSGPEFEQQECIGTERGEWAPWKTWSACDGQCADFENVPKDRTHFHR